MMWPFRNLKIPPSPSLLQPRLAPVVLLILIHSMICVSENPGCQQSSQSWGHVQARHGTSCFRNTEVLRIRGGRKGVSAKHSASEVASKTALATQNAGGGKAGLADRKGGKAGHAKFICPLCKQQTPSIKNMQDHYDSKHPKDVLDPAACQNAHEIYGGTTQGVAVQGTRVAAKKKKKESK